MNYRNELLLKLLSISISVFLLGASLFLYGVDERSSLISYTSTLLLVQVVFPSLPLMSESKVNLQIKNYLNSFVLFLIVIFLFFITNTDKSKILGAVSGFLLYSDSLLISNYFSKRDFQKYVFFTLLLSLTKLFSLLASSIFQFYYHDLTIYEFYTSQFVGSILISLIYIFKLMGIPNFNVDLKTFGSLPAFQNYNSSIGSLGSSMLVSTFTLSDFSGVLDTLYRIGNIINVFLVTKIRIIYSQKNKDAFKRYLRVICLFQILTALLILLILLGKHLHFSIIYFQCISALFGYSIINASVGTFSLTKRSFIKLYLFPIAMLIVLQGQPSLFLLFLYMVITSYAVKRILTDNKLFNPTW